MMNRSKKYYRPKNAGFTLIEIMISLLVFATGMLGVAFQMSQGIKNTLDTEIHSSVMQISLQAIEPLKKSTIQTFNDFKAELIELDANINSAPFYSNSSQENFSISVDRAVDRVDTDLLTSDTTTWLPPFTVVLKISYEEINRNNHDFFATHVLVPVQASR